jgi:hypothetical protein
VWRHSIILGLFWQHLLGGAGLLVSQWIRIAKASAAFERKNLIRQISLLSYYLINILCISRSQILLVVRANRCSPVNYLLYPYMQRLRYSLNRLHVRHSIFNVLTVGWMSPDTVLPGNFCQPVLLANHSVPGMSSHFLTYQIIDFYSGVSA